MLYLGVKLDTRLTWKDQIDLLVTKASAAIYVLRILAKVSRGTNPNTLLMVHRGFITAILEWGAVLKAGATKKLLKKLDTIQYSSLRIILGCMKSSPIPIILAEANEIPLNYRRELILNRNALRLLI